MSKKKKGQTSDPYGANYTGPTNTGRANQSLAGDAATLIGSGLVVKLLPALAGSVGNLLKSEWKDRTLSRGAWEDKQQFGIEPKGMEGWRPLKAFSPKMLKTAPTKGAEDVTKLLTIKQLRDKFKK